MTKKELKQKCADLGIDIQGLDTNAKLEAAIQAKEAELASIEVTAEVETETASEEVENTSDETETESETTSEETETETPEAKKAEEKEVPVYKDSRGRKWSFKAKAPGTLNIGGHPMTQQEILDSEEVITELVYGNSSYLTQID